MDARPFCSRAAVSVNNDLRALRSKHSWSQDELGKRLGVSRQTINAIEARRYDPSLPLAFRISRLFALKIEDIFSADAEKA